MILPNLCYSKGELLYLHEYKHYYSNALKYINLALSIVTCLLGVVGNTTVICYTGLIMKNRKSKIWFLNLAIADLLSVLLLPLHTVATLTHNWPFGTEMCKLFLFSVCANMYASVLIIIALNITRVLSVTQPMFHLKFLSQRVSCWTCTTIWTIAIFSTLPLFFFSGEVQIGEENHCLLLGSNSINNGHGTSVYNMSEGNISDRIPIELQHFSHFYQQCSEDQCCGDEDTLNFWNGLILSAESFAIPLLLMGYFVPLCVVIISNITIVLQVRKSQTANTHRLYKVIVVVILAYFITWTPLVIGQIIILDATRNMNLIVMFKVITFMPILVNISYINCFLNPILYVLVSRRIRTGLVDFVSSIRSKLSYKN